MRSYKEQVTEYDCDPHIKVWEVTTIYHAESKYCHHFKMDRPMEPDAIGSCIEWLTKCLALALIAEVNARRRE